MSDNRLIQLQAWLNDHFKQQSYRLEALVNDASFRRYFRVTTDNGSFIAMDAPPTRENSLPFVAILEAWLPLGLHVPKCIREDLTQGFLLLEDLGDNLLLRIINEQNADELYKAALNTLTVIQQCHAVPRWPLPYFNRPFITEELSRIETWFLDQMLHAPQISRSPLYQLNRWLLTEIPNQPYVCVHRDYHSRNLLQLANNDIGIIDFQDAIWGPITYDAVSLLRDCYIAWPPEQVTNWLRYFFDTLQAQQQLSSHVSWSQFQWWFDLTSLQRHLKVVGIFARLRIRDGKTQYVRDIPQACNYIIQVAELHPRFADFARWFEREIVPRFMAVQDAWLQKPCPEEEIAQ